MSAAFWAFLWGPIGLVLSAPLTVVLLVLGKYVPQLEFLDILLGDKPALEPDVAYYQRLLAHDQDEAEQLVLAKAKGSSLEQVCDELLIPTLNHVRHDRLRDNVTAADEKFVLQATREVLEDLGHRHPDTRPGAGAEPPVRILACPAGDDADRLALEMLARILEPSRWVVEVAGVEALTAELVELAAVNGAALICIGALPPGGLAHTRYLCKRLRAQSACVRIIVGRWGLRSSVEENHAQLLEAGADLMTATLRETRNQLNGWFPVLARDQEKTLVG